MAEEEKKVAVRVWVPHEKDVWQLLLVESHDKEVSSEQADEVVVITESGEKKSVSVNNIHALDPTHLLNLDDLCGMSNLHEAPLLDMLKRRSISDQIYTNTGSVLISINPYKRIEGLYESPLLYYLHSDNMEAIAAMPPHVYKIANGAYISIADGEGKNQSVVVSGESGAGKTEASKHVMNFLIAVNEADIIKKSKLNAKSPRKNLSETTAAGEHIKRVLLDSNNVLESFGNAKTVRNDNSSRFGKYIRLQYTANKTLVSAFTETFLLEKSRLTNGSKASVGVDSGERNYHVLYGMFVGSDSTLSRSDLLIDGALDKYYILCPEGGDPVLADDADNFKLLCSSLRELGVSDSELRHIWALLATILHLGNAEVQTLDSLSSISDGSVAPASTSFSTCTIDDITKTLGVTTSAFTQALTIHLVQLGRRGSVTRKILSADAVANNINALMKWLYSGMFTWLVKKINYAHCGHSGDGSKAEVDVDPAVNFIGILDIFGFEILKTNSFEQLCINFTNERLQQQFNEQVFVYEQIEYEKEGLNWSTISFQDNQKVIDLICKKPSGLLNVLEEHGFLNRKPDDKALLTSYDQMHNGKHPCYKKPRFGNESFIVAHFAGSVTYTINGFLDKNNDTLQEDLLALIDTSSNEFLLRMMNIENSTPTADATPPGYIPAIPEHLIVRITDNEATLEDEPGAAAVRPSSLRHSSSLMSSSFGGASSGNLGRKMASAVTVSFHFRHQLDDLMSTLRATHPHYIKCIKPNTAKAPNVIMPSIVMEQLRYSGILEVVRIRREGYPTRTPFQDFYSMFEILGTGRGTGWQYPPASKCSPEQARAAAEAIATAAFKHDLLFFQMGHSKIFLKDKGLDCMRLAVKNFYADSARVIQRRFLTRRKARWFQDLRVSAIDIQKSVRCWRQYRIYTKQVKAIKVIQWSVVGKRLRKEFALKCHMATLIRRRVRVFALKCLFKIRKRVQIKAIRVIQRYYRGYVSRRATTAKRAQYTRAQVLFSRHYRGYKQRARYTVERQKIILIQSIARRALALKAAEKRLKCCIQLQARGRCFVGRNRYLRDKSRIIQLQSVIRMAIWKKKYVKARCSVVLSQAVARKMICRKQYLNSLARCVRIQCNIRKAVARLWFKKTRACAICLQSVIRMAIWRTRYQDAVRRIIIAQSVVRRQLRVKHYEKSRRYCVSIQTQMRRKLSRDMYLSSRLKVILLQSTIRMALATRRYKQERTSIIRIQSVARQHSAHVAYRRSVEMCVRVQAVIRRLVYKLRYAKTRHAVISTQAAARMCALKRHYLDMRRKCILIQAVGRRRACVKDYRMVRSHWILVQKVVRCRLQVQRYLRMRSATKRLKVCARRFLRNMALKKRIIQLHGYCQSGDADAVKNHLSADFFTDLAVRNKWDTYQTCLHTACQFGQLTVVQLLEPTAHEILQKDINGNTALHHAAMLPNIEVVKALEKRLLMSVTNLDTATATAAPTAGNADGQAGDTTGGGDSDDEDAVNMLGHLDLGDKIKEGFLKKVSKGRWGTRQQKRWVELHEEHLIYFKNKGDKVPRGTIPLNGATVKRHPAANSKEGPSFEIFSEEIALKKKKENASLLFVSDSEKELQGWLIPLKVLVGIDSAFRTTSAVTYVNSGLRDAWLAETNAFGETPLHIAARFYNGACPFIRTQTVEKPVPIDLPTGGDTAPSTPARDIRSSRRSTLDPVPLSPFRPQVPLVRVLQLCMWLIESGCNIDATNLDGQTALHLAVQHRNVELVSCLVLKGASVKIRDNNRSTPEYFANGATLNALKKTTADMTVDHSSMVIFSPLLHPPIHISGYSYLSIHFMKHALSADFTNSLSFLTCGYDFYLSISVVNRGSELVETKQDIKAPVIVRDSYLWWACTWNMQTPLENLDDDCSVKMELYRIGKVSADTPPPAPLIPARRRSSANMTAIAESMAKNGPVLVSTAVFAIDFATIDSGVLNIPFMSSDVGEASVDHSFVEVDCMLLRRSKSITLDKYRQQVYSAEPRVVWFDSIASNYTTDREEPKDTAGLVGTSVAVTAADVDNMGVKELKKQLSALNVEMTGLLEVSEFKTALKNALPPAPV